MLPNTILFLKIFEYVTLIMVFSQIMHTLLQTLLSMGLFCEKLVKLLCELVHIYICSKSQFSIKDTYLNYLSKRENSVINIVCIKYLQLVPIFHGAFL